MDRRVGEAISSGLGTCIQGISPEIPRDLNARLFISTAGPKLGFIKGQDSGFRQ